MHVLAPQAGIPPGLALDPAAHAGGLGFEDVLTVRTGHRIETLGIGGHGGGTLTRPAPSGRRVHLWGDAPPILWMLPTSRRVAPARPPTPTGVFVLGGLLLDLVAARPAVAFAPPAQLRFIN
jgi:hypothetical protein